MDEWFKDWFDADYATLYAHRDEEEADAAVATALRLAPELARGPVLDLACGTGRHVAALRHHNPLAFGLDLSQALLGEALPEIRPWLLRGDMRHLPLKAGCLSGITLWFTPFGYFSDEANRRLLAALAGCLKPGGVLLLDFLNAAQVMRTLVEEDTLERGGLRAHSRRTLEGHRIVKRMTVTQLEAGTSREVVESVRLYTPDELRLMASSVDLTCFRELGDYEGSAFSAVDSRRWIGIFHKNFKP